MMKNITLTALSLALILFATGEARAESVDAEEREVQDVEEESGGSILDEIRRKKRDLDALLKGLPKQKINRHQEINFNLLDRA